MRYEINKKRLESLSPEPDIDSFRKYLEAFSKVCAGCPTGGVIAKLEVPERFRWLTAIVVPAFRPQDLMLAILTI